MTDPRTHIVPIRSDEPRWHDRGPLALGALVVVLLCGAVVFASMNARALSHIGHAPPARLDLNTASQAELELLPNIGPARAEDIILMRERVGGFRRLSQLERVHGIGPKTVEGIAPYVTLD